MYLNNDVMEVIDSMQGYGKHMCYFNNSALSINKLLHI